VMREGYRGQGREAFDGSTVKTMAWQSARDAD
jgi:hypothetical protein